MNIDINKLKAANLPALICRFFFIPPEPFDMMESARLADAVAAAKKAGMKIRF